MVSQRFYTRRQDPQNHNSIVRNFYIATNSTVRDFYIATNSKVAPQYLNLLLLTTEKEIVSLAETARRGIIDTFQYLHYQVEQSLEHPTLPAIQ